MKVLLLGDYSGLHVNLAKGLRRIGIDVSVASNGDGWKNIPRDIDLRQPTKFKQVRYAYKLLKNLPKLKGYDIVQLISPNFLISRPSLSNIYFNMLKGENEHFFCCACGMEYHYIKYALTGRLKYSVFYIPEVQNDGYIKGLKDKVNTPDVKKLDFNVYDYCKGIISTSNGYYHAYKNYYPEKTTFIPLPIDTEEHSYMSTIENNTCTIKFFLGLMKEREKLKGTDRIYSVLKKMEKKYPNDIELNIANSIPFREYTKLLNESHVLCDQLYAYGIGMNGLIAQSKGLIVGGGADPEMYDFLGENDNRPIIDLNTSDDKMFQSLEMLIENKSKLKEHSLKSRAFVVDNYDSVKVAKQYVDFWKSKMS